MAHLLERVYPHMPVCVQNLGISLYGLGYRRERFGGRFDAYVDEFRGRDRWTAPQFDDYIEQELRRVLLQAFDHTPFYRSAWTQAGLSRRELARMTVRELPRLPVTSKADLRRRPDAFLNRDAAGKQRLREYYSSGSTGTPITYVCTSDVHRRVMAAREARSFGWSGTSVRWPRSMIGGRFVLRPGASRPPFYRYNWAEKQVYISAFHISPACVPAYLEAFQRYRPRVLTGYAWSHYLLARLMLDQGVTLDYAPAALVLSSEKLTPEMKSVIHRAFHARAYSEYGAVENCFLATECAHGGLHISPDFGIIELLDDEGQPVPPGREGRVVCTGLLNDVQPLVRYEVGDLAILSPQPCPCGRRHLPLIQELLGRVEDCLLTVDGRIIRRFHKVFFNLPHVVEGQIVQEALDRIRVRVVTDKGFSSEDSAAMVERLRGYLGPVQVSVECVESIERTERGKFRSVVSKLPTLVARS